MPVPWQTLMPCRWARALVTFPEPLPVGWTLVAGLVLAGISLAAIRAVRTRPYVTMGWFWFVIAMAPVSGVLQAGQQWTADRFAYVPFIGLYVALVWLVAPVVASVRYGAVITSVAVILAAGVATHTQLGYWKNGEVLWRRILATGGDPIRGNIVLGFEMSRTGRKEAAIEHFEAVLRVQPDHAEAEGRLGTVHAELADALERSGRLDEAVAHYRNAVRLMPDAAEVQNNFGALLASQGRAAEALPHFAAAVLQLPNWESARLNYAVALAQTNQPAEAIRQFEEVLRINPSNAVARRALGR
jgi:tetratricopeptide (TPR) repeat protein